MLNTTANFRELLTMVTAATKAAGTGALRLTAHGQVMAIEATTAGMRVTTGIWAGSKSDGKVIISGKDLGNALKAVKPRVLKTDAKINLKEAADGGLTVQFGGSARTIGAAPDGLFPVDMMVPDMDGDLVATGGLDELAGLIWSVAVGAQEDLDAGLRQIEVVHFHREPGSVLVIDSTDRYRIHRGLYGDPEATPVDVTVHQTTIAAALTMMLDVVDGATDLSIRAKGGRVYLVCGKVMISLDTVPVEFPTGSVQKLIEQATGQIKVVMTLDKMAIIEAVLTGELEIKKARTALVDVAKVALAKMRIDKAPKADIDREIKAVAELRKTDIPLTVAIKGSELHFGLAATGAKWSTTVDIATGADQAAKLPAGDRDFQVSLKFFADALAGIHPETVELHYTSPTKPIILAGPDFTGLLMPIKRPQDSKPAAPVKATRTRKPAAVKAAPAPVVKATRTRKPAAVKAAPAPVAV